MSANDEGAPLSPHGYDGIREFDNPLPGWWVAIFWVTIVFSVGYYLYYELGQGESIVQAYDRDMVEYYDLQTKSLAAAGNISEEMLHEMSTNSSLVAAAKQTFGSKCAVCHGEQAEGKIGPNLTDNYWLHGGRLTDIFRTISEGVPEKGMVSWKTQLSPAQMMSLAAFVGTLRGSAPPGGRPPQGDLFDPQATAVGH